MQAFFLFIWSFLCRQFGWSCQRTIRLGNAPPGKPNSNRTRSANALTWSNLLLIKDQALHWLGKASKKEVGDFNQS